MSAVDLVSFACCGGWCSSYVEAIIVASESVEEKMAIDLAGNCQYRYAQMIWKECSLLVV